MCYGNPTVKGGIKASSDFKDDAWWLWQGVYSKNVYISNLFNSDSQFYYSALGEEVADYDTIQQ